MQSDANEMVIKNNYTFVRDVFIGRSKVMWMFDRVIIFYSNNFSLKFYSIIEKNKNRLVKNDFVLNLLSIDGFPLPI